MQPAPKLGEWVDILTEILEKEGGLPVPEELDPHEAGAFAQGR